MYLVVMKITSQCKKVIFLKQNRIYIFFHYYILYIEIALAILILFLKKRTPFRLALYLLTAVFLKKTNTSFLILFVVYLSVSFLLFIMQ